MGNGYFQAGLQDRITYFDVFFATCRTTVRDLRGTGNSWSSYIQNLHFDEGTSPS